MYMYISCGTMYTIKIAAAYLIDGREVCERSTDHLETTCSSFTALDIYENIAILQVSKIH